ncbi:MAG: response regulator [Bacteroidota bacterium]|nr:response regulator [Bacteroidota bacterium]
MKYLRSILLIDDDSISNYLVKIQLNSLKKQYPYQIASNVAEALTYLKTLSKSSKVLVLLDIHMPVLNGFEFLEHLKNNKEIDIDLLDIVIISSSIAQVDVDKAKSIGIHKFLVKPILLENLQEIINDFELV